MDATKRCAIFVAVSSAVCGASSSASAFSTGQLAVGGQHACALFQQGGLRQAGAGPAVCWGLNSFGQASPPSDSFKLLTAGEDHTCGLHNDGTVVCWGDDTDGETDAPPGNFETISAGNFFTCGVRIDGTLACWGRNDLGQSSPPGLLLRGLNDRLSAGYGVACVASLMTDGFPVCWGDGTFGATTPPPASAGASGAIAVGAGTVCAASFPSVGVFTETCWGNPANGLFAHPATYPTEIEAGNGFFCQGEISLSCWGLDNQGSTEPPTNVEAPFGLGDANGCGVLVSWSSPTGQALLHVTCWGSNQNGQSTPPTACSAGEYGFGGVTPCTPCPAGTDAPTAGAETCQPCASGTYSPMPGSSQCSACPAGTFSSTGYPTGATSCTPCGPGTYSPAQSQGCYSCQDGWIAASGSASCSVCPAGFTSDPPHAQCVTPPPPPPIPALVLNGSDALWDVVQAILSDCSAQFPGFGANGVVYQGGGSGAGASRMLNLSQQIAPMSRSLASAEYCATSGPAVIGGAAPGLSESLLIGLDGVSILANEANSCSTAAANGVGASSAFVVTNDGTATGGTPATCPGCNSSNAYTFGAAGSALYAGQPSFDALAVLYFGLTHDGTYDCASPVRRSLIKNWKNLFASDCAAGDGTCTSGLTHAWRLSDLSGTTDALVSILNPPGKGLGTLPNVPVGAAQKANPFCNSFDANHPGTMSFAGGSDYQDLDPVRTLCSKPGGGDVCEVHQNFSPTKGNRSGDLGVVLPIVVPEDAPPVLPSDLYPTVTCSAYCALVAPLKSSFIPPGFICPGSGLPPNQGFCFMPSTLSGDPRCISSNINPCFDVVGKPDTRAYNQVIVVDQRQLVGAFQKYKQPGSIYQMALDANGRIINGAFFRIHNQIPGTNNVPDATAGTTGLCRETDAVSQVGCLTDSDPCSIGYAARSAATFYPGLGTPPIPQPASLKALAVNGTPPFTPASVDPDLAIENLLAAPGTTPLYPLARRLYLSTISGFAGLPTWESELAACFGNNGLVGPAMSTAGLVPVPGGIRCLDYPEELASTATPPPNVQGPGNVAFGGCGSGMTGQNACQASPPIIQ